MGYRVLRVRTHIIAPGEDLAALIRRYVLPIAAPGDVAVLSESAVAVAEGRAVPYYKVRPGLLARFLSRFPHPDGSLATPPAMQLAIHEVGALRILLGAAAAALGRLVGRRGLFFRVAGPELARIDDIGGTLPPFDDCIVLGPRDPRGTAARLRAATGLDVAIADADDIGHVDILANTSRLREGELKEVLRRNPAGNDDQQTPVVVVRRWPD